MSADLPASEPENADRRTAIAATAVLGGAGVVAAAVPFVASLTPSERARAAGAPIKIDVGAVAPGEMRTFEWRGKPVWVLRRTPEMIEAVRRATPEVADPESVRVAFPTPEYARNELRSIKPELFVAVGICTHLGCSPVGPLAANVNPVLGDDAGFFCPCHGSSFDLAGRVFRGMPAPDNLEIPPHKYLADTVVLVGDDTPA